MTQNTLFNVKSRWINVALFLGLSVTYPAHASNFYHLEQAVADAQVLAIAPVFDFDGDGCFPAAGISRAGEQNAGLDARTGTLGGNCRNSDFLNYSNTLHRSLCVDQGGSEYCGHFYSLYFEKDKVLSGYDLFGHRHDWEQAAVWTKNGEVTHGSVSAHGEMTTRAIADIPHTNSHIRVVYHKDGIRTHSMRFAGASEAAENPYQAFVTPPVISWFELYGDNKTNTEMRALLNGFNYGSATIPLKDSNFLNNLNRFKPDTYPDFFEGEDCQYSAWFSEEGGAGAVCTGDRVVTGIQCSGRYCDNKRLKCCSLPSVTPHGGQWTSNWISEESPNSWAWDDAALVGLSCSGRYCDNLKLILRNHLAPAGSWTKAFSEEQGLGQCAKGSYVAGIRCTGDYCDDLSLYCQQP
ncbi:NPP1 family protein [Reinekea sp. G2M2-21]|uniref:NPP1 family protein n=1 Tax=Reinekea sp. G2M2-21 TaxID=2788942 RepID=UPI0018AA9C1A|nr:NPP1 family protein [Reinekea sp. G2M2-21]